MPGRNNTDPHSTTARESSSLREPLLPVSAPATATSLSVPLHGSSSTESRTTRTTNANANDHDHDHDHEGVTAGNSHQATKTKNLAASDSLLLSSSSIAPTPDDTTNNNSNNNSNTTNNSNRNRNKNKKTKDAYRLPAFLIAFSDLIYTLAIASSLSSASSSSGGMHPPFGDRQYTFTTSVLDIVWITVVRTLGMMYQTKTLRSNLTTKLVGYCALGSFLFNIVKLGCIFSQQRDEDDDNENDNDDAASNHTHQQQQSMIVVFVLINLIFCSLECGCEFLIGLYSSITKKSEVAPTARQAAEGITTTRSTNTSNDDDDDDDDDTGIKSIGLWELLQVLKPYFWPDGLLNRACVMLTWIFLILSKAANILAPLYIAKATDDLANSTASNTPDNDDDNDDDDSIQNTSTRRAVTIHIVLYALLLFSNKALKELQSLSYVRVKLIAGVQLRENVFHHLLQLSIDWHQKKSLGAVVTAMSRGIQASNLVVQYLFLYLFPTLVEAVVVVIVFIQQFGSPILAVVAGVGCIVYIVITIELTIFRMQYRKQMNKADNDAANKVSDALLNIETVKYFAMESHELVRFRESVNVFQDSSYKIQISLSILNTAQQLVLNTTLVGALLVAAYEYTTGMFTVGQFVAVNVYIIQLFAPLNFLGTIYGMAIGAFVDLQNLCNILAETFDIQDKVGAHNLMILPSSSTEIGGGATAATTPALDVEFKNVVFAYPSRKEITVLKNISFVIPAGTTTAIVGSTGSGKSTLTRLLFRFYEADRGEVLLGGHNVLNLTQRSLRQTIGVVPQDPILFNDTLAYNIQYGAGEHIVEPTTTTTTAAAAAPTTITNDGDDDDIENNEGIADADIAGNDNNFDETNEKIWKVAKMAQLDDFIRGLPKQMETVVGERGQQVSGGEKQRIAIARILMKSTASVCVFDEATSSLDSRTEQSIQNSIDTLLSRDAGRTMLIIAHRLSTVQNADQIIVMDSGSILERGSHHELLSKGTWHDHCYASLWDKQQQKKKDE